MYGAEKNNSQASGTGGELGEVKSQDGFLGNKVYATSQALKYPMGNIQTECRVPGYWTALPGWDQEAELGYFLIRQICSTGCWRSPGPHEATVQMGLTVANLLLQPESDCHGMALSKLETMQMVEK